MCYQVEKKKQFVYYYCRILVGLPYIALSNP